MISTIDVADISGLTPRRLDCYARAGVFGPEVATPGSGNHRTFKPLDVRIACVLAALGALASQLSRPSRLSPPTARAVADAVREADAGRWLVMDCNGRIQVLLDIEPRPSAGIVIDLYEIAG